MLDEFPAQPLHSLALLLWGVHTNPGLLQMGFPLRNKPYPIFNVPAPWHDHQHAGEKGNFSRQMEKKVPLTLILIRSQSSDLSSLFFFFSSRADCLSARFVTSQNNNTGCTDVIYGCNLLLEILY